MKLSIVIPIYNAKNYIRECLESVAKLSITDMECILVNDESKDESRDICKEFVDRDERFKLIEKKNGGVSSTRNAGLAEAKGNYIFFLDADDYLLDAAEQLLTSFLEEEKADFLAFAYQSLWEDGSKKDELFTSTDVMQLAFADSALNTCWGKLFQKDIIDENQISFDESLPIGEDYKFVAQYLEHANKPLICNEPIIAYRQHGASAMRRYSMDQRLAFTRILLNFQKDTVRRMMEAGKLPDNFTDDMYAYYLRVLTALCREFATKKDIKLLMEHEVTEEVLLEIKPGQLGSLKKLEYKLLMKKKAGLATGYFVVKGKL